MHTPDEPASQVVPAQRRRRLGVVLVVLLTSVPDPIFGSGNGGAPQPRAAVSARNMELVANIPSQTGGDITFWGDTAIFGIGADDNVRQNDGFQIVDISNPARPRELGRFICAATYDDISMWRELVFLTVNVTLGGTRCDETGGEEPFSGLRVVSIANPRKPVQIATVNQDCQPLIPVAKDWINHTLVPDLRHEDGQGRKTPRLLIYTTGGCAAFGGAVVEVPLRDPAAARVVGEVVTAPTVACHDLSVLAPRKLAAAACFSETQIWDLTNPEAPLVIAHIDNPAITGHHGTSFSWDGQTLIIADERGGFHARPVRENEPTCAGTHQLPAIGGLWFYDIVNPAAPVPRGYFTLAQAEPPVCSPHAFNVIPLRDGRDVLVAGWYSIGARVVDFTDVTAPKEVAYYAVPGGPTKDRTQAWAAYWYNGFVYSNNMLYNSPSGRSHRGFDILSVDYRPLRSAITLDHLNPQTLEFLIEE